MESSANSEMAEPLSSDHSVSAPKRKYKCKDCNSYSFESRIYLEHRQSVHCENFEYL